MGSLLRSARKRARPVRLPPWRPETHLPAFKRFCNTPPGESTSKMTAGSFFGSRVEVPSGGAFSCGARDARAAARDLGEGSAPQQELHRPRGAPHPASQRHQHGHRRRPPAAGAPGPGRRRQDPPGHRVRLALPLPLRPGLVDPGRPACPGAVGAGHDGAPPGPAERRDHRCRGGGRGGAQSAAERRAVPPLATDLRQRRGPGQDRGVHPARARPRADHFTQSRLGGPFRDPAGRCVRAPGERGVPPQAPAQGDLGPGRLPARGEARRPAARAGAGRSTPVRDRHVGRRVHRAARGAGRPAAGREQGVGLPLVDDGRLAGLGLPAAGPAPRGGPDPAVLRVLRPRAHPPRHLPPGRQDPRPRLGGEGRPAAERDPVRHPPADQGPERVAAFRPGQDRARDPHHPGPPSRAGAPARRTVRRGAAGGAAGGPPAAGGRRTGRPGRQQQMAHVRGAGGPHRPFGARREHRAPRAQVRVEHRPLPVPGGQLPVGPRLRRGLHRAVDRGQRAAAPGRADRPQAPGRRPARAGRVRRGLRARLRESGGHARSPRPRAPRDALGHQRLRSGAARSGGSSCAPASWTRSPWRSTDGSSARPTPPPCAS